MTSRAVLSLLLVASTASAAPLTEVSCTDCLGGGTLFDDDDDSWRRPKRLRAALELGAVLGAGATWYWIERDRQVADWDFPSLRERFTSDAYINDNNPFAINYAWHTLGGAYFHLAGRSNDLGLIESTLFGLGASLVWEYGIEFREKLSLNDMIVTTVAGVAAGEFLHWFGRLMQQRDGGVGGDAARWSLGVFQTAHDTIDGRCGPRGPQIAASMRLSTGYAHASTERDNGGVTEGSANLAQVRFEGHLAAFSSYMRPGWRQSTFRDGNLTSLEASLAGGDGSSARFHADTMVFGWRNERVDPDGNGLGFIVGTSVGARYQEEDFESWRDRFGAVHMPGFAVDAVARGRSWTARASARAHLDYAGIHAMSFDRWAAANPMERGKSILAEQGYFYAWGASTRLAAELNASRFGLGVSMFHGRYRSQQGFDRVQEMLTVDQIANAKLTDVGLWLRGRLTKRTFVEYRRDSHYRTSDIEGVEGTNRARRRTIELGTYF